MKKFLLWLLTLTITLPAFARDFQYTYNGQTLTYTVISESARTCQTKVGSYNNPGNKVSGTLEIPAYVSDGTDNYSVVAIGKYAFAGCSGLTKVSIPNSVASIGVDAFSNCSGLTKVSIPNSVASIGFEAFSNCSSLTSVTIPNSVASIEASTFYCCSNLTSVTIPNSVTSIGVWAFTNCSNLTSVTIPNSVTSIGEYAFCGCCGLTSVTISNSVTSIGVSAFNNCSNLTSVTIPNSVTSIGRSTFSSCDKLTDINSEILHPENCNAVDMFTAGGGVTPFNFAGATLTVPAGTAEKYRATVPWSNFTNIVERIPATFTLTDATLRMGEAVTVPVSMNNSVDITSFQCDIQLPAGFEVATDAQGAPVVALSGRKSDSHSIQATMQTYGTVHVTSSSDYNAPFSGSEGVLFTFTLQHSLAAVGVYELTIDNILASKPDAESVNIEPAKCMITLENALESGDVNDDDSTAGVENVTDGNAPAQYYNLQGMPVHTPQKGMIYIRKTAASAEKVVY